MPSQGDCILYGLGVAYELYQWPQVGDSDGSLFTDYDKGRVCDLRCGLLFQPEAMRFGILLERLVQPADTDVFGCTCGIGIRRQKVRLNVVKYNRERART